MIVSFTIQNFLSFRDPVTLSFEATSDTDREQYYVVDTGKYRLLKMAMLYGANASGKTNVLYALNFLRKLAGRESGLKEDSPEQLSFAFDEQTRKGNSVFEIRFVIPDADHWHEYVYRVEFNTREIGFEQLSYYATSQPSKIFTRKKDTRQERGFVLKTGDRAGLKKGDRDLVASGTLPHQTILSVFARINPEFAIARRAYEWFDTQMMPVIDPGVRLGEYTFTRMLKRADWQERAFQVLGNSDTQICGFTIEKTEEMIPDDIKRLFLSMQNKQRRDSPTQEEEPEIPDTMKRLLIRMSHRLTVDGKQVHGNLPLDQESRGTVRLLEMMGPLFTLLEKKSILSIDEIESSFHPEMARYFILLFLLNAGNSQLLLTTHNLLLLEWDSLRKDVVWFTEKDAGGATDLYSMSDFRGVNRYANLRKAYESGVFGALPDPEAFRLNLAQPAEEGDESEE